MYKVSIIIPITDDEKDFEECLNSIFNQSLEDIQVICVNNGLKQKTLFSFSSKNNFKLINDNGNLLNNLLKESEGEYICFINTPLKENLLELLYNKAKSDNSDMLISGDISSLEKYSFIDSNSVFKLYKKEFIKNNLHLKKEDYFDEDTLFYESIFKTESISYLNEPILSNPYYPDIIKSTNRLIEIFIENNQYSEFKKEIINYTFSLIVDYFNKTPLEEKEYLYKRIRKEFKGFNELKEDFIKNLDNKKIYEIFSKNSYYLDYLSEYKLSLCEYSIYDGLSDGNSQSKLTVVIPIYNNETLIHRTLMSIENQTIGLENIEVLMVNDGSTDNTSEIINSYVDRYANFKSIHINEGTGSPGTPRNIGIREASSDYIIFLDHDDYFETDALSKLYDSIKENDCDFVYGTYVSVDYGTPTKILYPNEYHGYFDDIYQNPRSIAFPPPSIWTKLFRRDFLLENSILFPTILGEDAVFLSKALFNAKGIKYLHDDLICYHDLSSHSSTVNVGYDYFVEGFVSEKYLYDIYSNFESYFDNNGPLNLYRIRAETILDFYLRQFYLSNLTVDEIENIFPLLYEFVERINKLGIKPETEYNKPLFVFILEKDIDSIIEYKKERIRKLEESRKVSNTTKVRSRLGRIKSRF